MTAPFGPPSDRPTVVPAGTFVPTVADHPIFSAIYDAALKPFEARGLGVERHRTLSLARGRVLDVGAGTGLNLPHYPPAVDHVVACEPEPGMRRRLAARAEVAAVPVTIVPHGIPGLLLEPESFDTVVCTLVLCTVPDLARGLEELRNLLAADGQLLFLEHVLARTPVGPVQRAVAPGWAHLAGGCHLDRDIIASLRAAGFVVTDCERPQPLGRISAQTVVRGRAIPRRGT